MPRYITIHGHFYQPPRENPWLESVELQDSAYPYHDWNTRITAECYAPNAASRILDQHKKIIDIVSNYEKISFNFGPTLLSWMQQHQPQAYQQILDADAKSRKTFGGHGSALAQCYNHMIMPLANSQDKRTQVLWGVYDFEHRFKRKPEGMWLPETAVDLETLDLLASFGIKFTILAPHQAKRAREFNSQDWQDVSGAKIDTRRPYVCKLKNGKSITIFFYDGPVSQELAFGNLLSSGEGFAGRLVGLLSSDDKRSQLAHIATDGETYGHHHRFGDMALAYCIYHLETQQTAQVTIYGYYLEKYPPTAEVEIFENTSWSCAHGIERWRDNCGCHVGAGHNWSQLWRKPLRRAMDWLRDNLVEIFETEGKQYFKDPWAARDAYISVILNRSAKNVKKFFVAQAKKELKSKEQIAALKLLEMQRNSMLMYTSCGWFFDEISGIETVQILNYAARAMQLAFEISDINFEDDFVAKLAQAPSNMPEFKDAVEVYRRFVKPELLDLLRVGAHYAVSSLFVSYAPETIIYSYQIKRNLYEELETGKQKLVLGKMLLTSLITGEEKDISFAALHLGDHNVVAGVRSDMTASAIKLMLKELKEAFNLSDITKTIKLIEKHFPQSSYALNHLFKDEQRRVIDEIIKVTLSEAENSLRQVIDNYYPFILAVKQMGFALPKVITVNAQEIIYNDIIRELNAPKIELKKLKKLVTNSNKWGFIFDPVVFGYAVSQRVNALMREFYSQPQELAQLKLIDDILELVKPFKLQLNLWEAQNVFFALGKNNFPACKQQAAVGKANAQDWVKSFAKLSEHLGVKIE